MPKSADAFRSIGEVAALIGVAPHVLRYWETQFPQLAPVKRADGRRYYRPDDIRLAAGLCEVMREDGMTARGAARLLAPDKGAAVRARGAERLAAMDGTAPVADGAAPKRSRRAEAGAKPKPAARRKPAAMPLFDGADAAGTDAAGRGAIAPAETTTAAERARALPPEAGAGIADVLSTPAAGPATLPAPAAILHEAAPSAPVMPGPDAAASPLGRIDALSARLRALPPDQLAADRLRPAAARLRALLAALG